MKKIYIVTTYTGTVLSYLIRNISKTPYAHVSISLDEGLKPMYAFGRINPRNPMSGGFVEEHMDQGLYAIRPNTMCRVYSLQVTDEQYENLYKNIMTISNDRQRYNYDRMALIYLTGNKPREANYKYVCPHFVADMLQKSNIKVFDKPPHMIRPDDFYDKEDFVLEYEGLLSKYNSIQPLYLPNVARI